MILRKKIPATFRLFLKKSKSFSRIHTANIVSIAMISAVMAGSMIVRFPVTAKSFDAKTEIATPKTSLVLSKNTAQAVGSIKTVPSIVPGESEVQRAEREKAEAAKAKAEAELAAQSAKLKQISRNVISRERRIYTDPADFNQIYAAAAERFGVDASLLKAIHYVETGCSGSTTKSNPSGATGPMQFLRSTFNRHGVDGNNDGINDISNVEDAIFSAAAYLRACGYPDVQKALWGYNPSRSYYNKVMDVARTFGYNK